MPKTEVPMARNALPAATVDLHLGRRDPSAEKLQLSELAARHLREQIVSGRLGQGTHLRIDTIAKSLGISTTPVREGLLILQSEALVRLLPRRGFVVNGFSRDDVMDMFWAQATVGAELAARATRRMSNGEIETLVAVQARHDAAVATSDHAEASRLGHQFHKIINLAAGSARLALLMGSLTRQLPNRFYTSIEGQLEDAARYHPVIIDAIRLRDVEAVRSLMFRHILSGGEYLVAMLERQGFWPAQPTTGAAGERSGARRAMARR